MKRVCAFVLCLCLVLAMVPATAAETGNVSLYDGNATTYYNTVEDALAAANSGTVSLLKDMTAGRVFVPKGVTLDLNGFALTADMAVVFEGQVVDKVGTGKIVVAQGMMKIIGDNDGLLPMWDSTEACYTLASASYQQMITVAADMTSARYIFIPNFSSDAVALLEDGGADNDVSIKVLLTWNNGASQQSYTFSENLVQKVYSSFKNGVAGQVFMLTISGIAGIDDMSVQAVVDSAAGGAIRSAALEIEPPAAPATYTVTFKDWNGTTLKTETVESGKAATAPADPTRGGYVFAGWDKVFDNVTGNLTVTATYTQVTDPTILIGNANGAAGDEVEIQIDLINSPELYAMSLKVYFDDTALTLVSAESGEAMDAFTYTAPSRLRKGSNFMWYANDPASGNGTVLTLTFKINAGATAGAYPITMTCDPSNTYDANDNDVNLEFVAGNIIVG